MAGTLTITDPATDNAPGYDQSTLPVRWRFDGAAGAQQVQRRVVVRRSGEATAISDTGMQTSQDTVFTLSNLASGIYYAVTISVLDTSGNTTSATRTVVSRYARSLPPEVVVSKATSSLTVKVNNPTSGSRPPVSSNLLYRRVAGSGSPWKLLGTVGPNSTFVDRTVRSNVTYEYFARGVAGTASNTLAGIVTGSGTCSATVSTTAATSNSTTGTTPDQITGLRQWFDGASITGTSNGAAVSSLTARTGGAVVSSTGTARPTYLASGVKSLPALRFDGTDDRLSLTSGGVAVDQPLSIFAVLDIKNATAGQEVLNLGGIELILNASGQTGYQSYAGALVSQGTVTTGMHLFMVTTPGDGSVQILLDGTSIGGGYVGGGKISATTLDVGVSPDGNRFLQADLYQFGFYNRNLSDPSNATDLQNLNNYFANRFGTGAATTPPATGSGSTGSTGGTGSGTGTSAGTGSQPGGTYTAAFGTRPASGPLNYDGLTNATISGKQFTGIGSDVSAIRLNNCSNVVIEQNDFTDCCQPITLTNCSNITVINNRARNITGPYQRNGTNRGNLIQVIYCGTVYIGYNKVRDGNTEDIISIYQSNGTQANPIIVEYNQLQNETYQSSSGSGIMLGDGGGTWQIARNNSLLNPGQVGIAAAGGRNISILNNVVYGDAKPTSNIGMYVCDYSQTAGGMKDITVQGNRVYYRRSDGVLNGFYTDGTAGTVNGQASNNFTDDSIDRASLVVTL